MNVYGTDYPEAPEYDPTLPEMTIDQAHQVFARWLGAHYDVEALDIVLSAAAVERLDGDPVWLLLVSGSGNAKTETVGALAGAGAFVTSTITSEGALLSATASKDKAKDATGGLLRKIGPRGLLVVKDVTSILSMNSDQRGQVLAALREVYDGKWERNVGTDGGRTLTWHGRIVLIGAVTTAYDRAHGVIAAMGDRFALVRVDSTKGRVSSGKQALRNVGSEVQMRVDLSEAAGAVLNTVSPSGSDLSEDAMDELLCAANLVTMARTAVEKDFKGNPEWAHAPEVPTRFAKMLGQVVRGALGIGLDHDYALALALRVARDSVPPLRLQCLLDVADCPQTRTSEVTKRLQVPRSTIDRALQELHILGLLVVDESDDGRGWRYSLADSLDPHAVELLRQPEPIPGNTTNRRYGDKEESPEAFHRSNGISGDALRFTPPTGPGRCSGCGFHAETQGHRPGCDRR